MEVLEILCQSEFIKNLKRVYQALSKEAAELKLDKLEEKWDDRYSIVINSWRNKCENLSYYFKYPEDIRLIIYTINII